MKPTESFLSVNFDHPDDPFVGAIYEFLIEQFPGTIARSKEGTVDAITTEFLGTNQHRYGPKPNPESLVVIRDVIRQAVDQNRRIPVLIPWGSRKGQIGRSVDIGELTALKQLSCLQRRVQSIYAPGIESNIRVEDASGNYLFVDEGQASRDWTTRYTRDFDTLVRITGVSQFTRVVPESSLFTESDLFAKADAILPAMVDYLEITDRGGDGTPGLMALKEKGWKGGVPREQREHYRSRYRSIYPGISEHDATVKLSRYLASALARVQLNGRAARPEWNNKYLQVTFVQPIPGAPPEMTRNFIYYRTIPLRFAATHIPPWRGRGYLKVSGDGQAIPKIANWHTPLNLTPGKVTISDSIGSVDVAVDYELDD